MHIYMARGQEQHCQRMVVELQCLPCEDANLEVTGSKNNATWKNMGDYKLTRGKTSSGRDGNPKTRRN